MSFSNKLFFSLLLFFLIVLVAIHGQFWSMYNQLLHHQIGSKAQAQAQSIAVIPSLKEAIIDDDIDRIETIIDPISKLSDASFIVIGNHQTYRLYHSAYQGYNAIKEKMVGEDNQEVLNGNSIISIQKGSLGVSLRGKSPILDNDDNVIGIVSVGYLQDEIKVYRNQRLMPLVVFLIIIIVALFIFSFWFSRSIKKQMLGLEPREIGLLFSNQQAVLESIDEGMIAIDNDFNIINFNKAALKLLNIYTAEQILIGKNINNYVTLSALLNVQDIYQIDVKDQICDFNQVIVIASRVRIFIDNNVAGWVITFRSKNDINELTTQLSQIREYVDTLRVLRHEHLNWMSVLSGLLSLGRYDEALELINNESKSNQVKLDFLKQNIRIPTLCGLLIGKTAKAKELNVTLNIDPQSRLHTIPKGITEMEFVSLVGNLIDNAITASLEQPSQFREVDIFISDASDDFIIEVSDLGCGIDEVIGQKIFEFGFSSKQEKDHGIGLYLAHFLVRKMGGSIIFEANEPQGTIFSIFIPKTEQNSEVQENLNEKN